MPGSLLIVVTVLIGLFMGNGITKPINSLTKAAERISHEEMNLKIKGAVSLEMTFLPFRIQRAAKNITTDIL